MEKELEELISIGKTLVDQKYDSPKVEIWRANALQFVRDGYPVRIADSFDRVFNYGQVLYDDMDWDTIHRADMQKAVEFLEELRGQKTVKPSDRVAPHKSKDNAQSTGILNQGHNNTFINVDTSGFDVGIHDQGTNTKVLGGRHTGRLKEPQPRWWETPWFQSISLLAAVLGIIGFIALFR